jgi:chaperone modulatory protein CbpM
MMKRHLTIQNVIIDDETSLTLYQLSEECQVQTDMVVEFVEHGLLEPQGHAPKDWAFSAYDLYRMQKALRLIHDLDLNYPGAALALDLMEEIEELRSQTRCFNQLLRDD